MKSNVLSCAARTATGALAGARALATMSMVVLLIILTSLATQAQIPTKHVRNEVKSGEAQLLSPLDRNQRMDLAIVLQLSDENGLNNLLQQLYDVTSPLYHQWLTPEQFTEKFGPTAADYQNLIDFARANGLEITGTHSNRLVLDVAGPAQKIETALNVRLNVYADYQGSAHENSTFFAVDREPTVPPGLKIYAIRGLDNRSTPQPVHLQFNRTGLQTFTTGSGPSGTFLGSDMRAAYYGGSALNGAGQSIGLYGLNFNMSDVQAYFNNVGQSFNSSVVQTVSINGYNTSCGSGCDDGEPVIDIIESYSMAPGVNSIIEYEASNDVDTFNRMATDNIAKQLSASVGWLPADPSSDEPIFQEFAAQGQNLFVASGDSGAFTSSNPVYYPADDPYVTAVGGTDLTTNGAGGSWQSESAWVGSSGGVSTNNMAIPSYQQMAGVINSSNHGSTSLRNIPDVAAEANTDNYFCANGSCSGGVGGTSLAAPRWAGFLALVNQQAANNGKPSVGFLNPTIYSIGTGSSYGSNFHDITSGNDDNSSGGYNAVSGYDLVTGWGSPNGQTLINTLAGGGSSCSPTAITPYIQVGSGSWQQTASATVSAGSNVNLGPQPVTGGSWNWTGPNGYSSTSRQIGVTVNSSSTYTATYTNSCGAKSTQAFTLSVPGGCTPTAITPYIQVNGGSWQQTASVTVSAGSTVALGPQPVSGGSWSWTGPNGYTSTSRQISITANSSGTYTATYTNSSGCQSTQTFTITVTGGGCTPTAITPYIQVNGGSWMQTASATVNAGSSVNLGPQPVTGGSWSWTGPNGYTSTSRQIGITVNSTSTYTATYTNSSGCQSTQAFTLTVSGSGGGSTCWAAWNSSTAYNGGAQVSYSNENYQAAYWTQNQVPSTNSGPAGSGEPWIPEGSCQ